VRDSGSRLHVLQGTADLRIVFTPAVSCSISLPPWTLDNQRSRRWISKAVLEHAERSTPAVVLTRWVQSQLPAMILDNRTLQSTLEIAFFEV
jgi:hypothetical protein